MPSDNDAPGCLARMLKSPLLYIGLAAVLYAVGFVIFIVVQQRGVTQVKWGGSQASISEESYYHAKVDAILAEWQNLGQNAVRNNERDASPSRVYLVFDAAKPALRLERDGRVLEQFSCTFAPGIEWQLLHDSAQGRKELKGVSRLMMRGADSSRQYPELFHLVGEKPGGGHSHSTFATHRRGSGSSSGGAFNAPVQAFNPLGEDSFPSLLVGAAEYAEHRKALAAAPPVARADGEKEDPRLAAAKANWFKAEMELYRGVEALARAEGIDLRNRFQIKPGPDFTAATSEFQGRRGGMFSMSGSPYIRTRLNFDYLGQDVWYARSAADPDRSMQDAGLEFLVPAGKEITDEEREDWLERGRARRAKEQLTAAPQWRATLANGATVEILGLCDAPSAGQQWWGPDGNPLEGRPYHSAQRQRTARKDHRYVELAIRTRQPRSNDGMSSTRAVEGSRGGSSVQAQDRYGQRLHEVESTEYAFPNSQKATTVSIGAAVGQWRTVGVFDPAGKTIKGQLPSNYQAVRLVTGEPKTTVRLEDKKDQPRSFPGWMRVVVRDATGKVYQNNGENHKYIQAEKRYNRLYTYNDIAEGQVLQIEIQFVPYDNVEFQNVSLERDRQTDFQIKITNNSDKPTSAILGPGGK